MAVDLVKLLKNRTEEQQRVIKYFHDADKGCFSKGMTDQEYDQLVMKKVSSMDHKQRALDKLGIDIDQVTEVEPVHFENWLFDSGRTYAKLGEDNNWRSSAYQVTWIFFSADQIYLYQYTFNMDEDGKKEQTEEYFYRDITNFSSSSESIEKEDVLIKTSCNGNKEYGRRMIETNVFKVVVPGDKLECAVKKNDYTESAIQGMKAKLREKKNA